MTYFSGLHSAGWGLVCLVLLSACGGGSGGASGTSTTSGTSGTGGTGTTGATSGTSGGPSGTPVGDASVPADAGGRRDGGAASDSSVPGEAGAFVCAGKPTQTCATCTSCGSCPGCTSNPGAGACEGTRPNCTTCPNDCTGCNGCTSGEVCVGDNSAVTCEACGNLLGQCSPYNCQGCSAGDDGGACVGTLTPCSALSGFNTCPTQVNCSAQPTTCTGTGYPCADFVQAACSQQSGCSWNANAGAAASCTGTIKPCAEISLSQCASVPGCGLVPAKGASSCDPTTSACFACGGGPADAGPEPVSICASPSSCCGMTVAAQSCQSQAACTMAPFVTSCDGAEDCPASGSCCVSLQLSESGATSGLAVKGTAACGQTCPVSASSGSYYFDDSVACHTGADCANVVDDSFGVPQNRCCSAAGFAVGECVSDTFKDIFLAGGGTCTN